jgi:glycerophosphoryl diester phosphodiesterase
MLKIAHRGASAYEVENSLSAFKKAVELGVDFIEADVQLTKDGIAVIRHDQLLDRTTNLSGYIGDFTFQELQEKAKLANNEPILSLEELCLFVSATTVKLYVDFKAFGSELTVVRTLLDYLPSSRFIFGAFHAGVLKNIKIAYPEITTVLILEGNLLNLEKELLDCQCDILALCYDSIDPDAIERAHAMGKRVFTWTVDDPRDIKKAHEMGVDGITSNFPDLI